jgi:hypothetical protein
MLLLGICAARADQEAKIAGLSCMIPDDWVLKNEMQGYRLSFESAKTDGEGDKTQKLTLELVSRPSRDNLERFKKQQDAAVIQHLKFHFEDLLGKAKLGGGALTRKDLVEPTSEIIEQNGQKFHKGCSQIPEMTDGKLLLYKTVALNHLDQKKQSALFIMGPEELFELNKDVISKILASFKIEEAEQDGGRQPATRSESK